MSVDVPSNEYFKKGAIRFYVNKGSLIFKKRNFRPTEELSLLSLRGVTFYVEVFNYRVNKLPFKVDGIYLESSFPKDKMSYKILKNLPYARRGYVFKDPVVQKYYEGLEWYRKNPNYKSSRTDWTEGEKEIDEQINKTSLKILRNLPYAKRGYVFKDYDIKLYTKSYKKDPSYKANFSSLPLVEQQWIKKIKAIKKSDKIDFYALADEFERLYKSCLHKSDKKSIEAFVLGLSHDLKRDDKKAIFSKVSAKVSLDYKEDNEMFFEILDELKELKSCTTKI